MSLEMKYFVLKPRFKHPDDRYALAACRAMIAYADSIFDHDSDLANSLRDWANREMDKITEPA